jgi:hypothetical protein
MAKLAKIVWAGIALVGAYELGRLSKGFENLEDLIISKMSDIVAEYREVKEVHDDSNV